MNWRSIAALMSLGSFAIATPLWLIFMARSGHARSSLEAGKSKEGEDARLWPHFLEIIRDRGFLFIVGGIFLTSAVDQALMQNYVNFLRADKGIVLSSIAWAGSLMGAMGIVSRIGTGWFYDRFSISGIRFSYMLLAISIFLALPVAGAATLFLFIAVRGITHGGLIVEAPVLAKHYLGTKNLGMTIGVISVFINLGFAAGPPVLGAFADANGNFTLGLVVYGFTAIVGFLLLVPVRPRDWVPPAKRESAAIEAGAGALQPAAAQPRH
jgi:MFS family permease